MWKKCPTRTRQDSVRPAHTVRAGKNAVVSREGEYADFVSHDLDKYELVDLR